MQLTGNRTWSYVAAIAAIILTHSNAEKQKRQIFREQVLPALGGKIPEEAFRTDRLALNRLNKEGITVPDGVILDSRHVHKHPHSSQRMPDVLKVYLTSDGRYVPPEGRYHYNHPKAVDTTYIIRKPFSRVTAHRYENKYINHKHRELSKPYAYTSYKQFLPLLPPSKPGIYKPIVAPFVLPTNVDLLENAYLPSWDIGFDFDTTYQPFDDYFSNNIAVFDTHQIISDYQGFLNEFHGRSSRNIRSKSPDKYQHTVDQGTISLSSPITSQDKAKLYATSNYTAGTSGLTKIPETNFSCRGRKGMFADIETKCQVFHSCSGWSRTSSICPVGTIFSETKGRCEWWNTVECKGRT